MHGPNRAQVKFFAACLEKGARNIFCERLALNNSYSGRIEQELFEHHRAALVAGFEL